MTESVHYRFTSEAFPDDTFTVVRFTGEEAISDLYRFRIDLIAENNDLDIGQLQSRSSTFTIEAGGYTRTIQGSVTQTELVDQPTNRMVYRVELRPRAWELSRGLTQRVYIDKTTPGTISQIMDDVGMTALDFQLDLEADYRKWAFRLQYSESYWNFLARICERDGVYYYFTAGDSGESIHFCDTIGHQPTLDCPSLLYVRTHGAELSNANPVVGSLVPRQTRPIKRITVRNYNDDKPSVPIIATAEVDPNGSGEADIYGQKALDRTEAAALADIRAEELLAVRTLYHGESSVCLLAPAHCFDLHGHPRTSANQQYQVLSIEHSGYDPRAAAIIGEEPPADTPAYSNRFTAIPADCQYRPPQTTPTPWIHGSINARIDAAGDGQYAELDDQGRYHVVFPFDTAHPSAKASHWLRLMQPYAGDREGMHWPLRKGARVLVQFLAGDPDLPVIAGGISNAEQPSIIRGDNQTCGVLATPAGNRFESDDNAGRERISLVSPGGRTRLRLGCADLGAFFASGNGSNNGDPDTVGSDDETDGMARSIAFGGSNGVSTTNAWAVMQTLWPDTPQRRDSALALDNAEIANVKDYDTQKHQEWRIRHGIDRIYRFPRKHAIPSELLDEVWKSTDYAEYLTALEEAEGRLHISRKLGDAYTYRSGSDFTFNGPDREAFDFGPKATFTACDPQTTSEDLRALVRPFIREGQRSSDQAEQYVSLRRGREQWNRWESELNQARLDLQTLEKNARDRASELRSSVNSGVPDIPGDALVFDDEASRNCWTTLTNRVFYSPDQEGCSDIKDKNDDSVIYGHQVIPDAFKARNTPMMDSIQDLESKVEQARKAYEEKAAEYHAAGAARQGSDENWSDLMRRSRISVGRYDSFIWHEGRIYDFGGCWNYNLGNGYEENLVKQDLDATNDDELDRDLLKTGGPDWIKDSDPWTDIVDPAIKGKLNENKDDGTHQMLVSKTIGDEYAYHNGMALDVHVGGSLSVRKGGPNVERTYSGANHLTEHVHSAGGIKQTWKRHPDSGALLTYDVESRGVPGHGAGMHSFSTAFQPSASLAIAASFTASAAINLAFSQSTTLNIGLSQATSINVGGSINLDITLAAKLAFTFSAAANVALSASTGLSVNVKMHAVAHLNIDAVSGKITGSFPALNTKVEPTAIEKKVMELEKRTTTLAHETMRINSNALQMNS